MQDIVIEQTNSVNKKITINIPREQVSKRFDDFYNDIKGKVVIKGFRKNHIPRSVLELNYGDQAKSNISKALFSEYFKRALQENNIVPASTPHILNVDNDKQIIGSFKDNSYTASVIVEVLPDVTINHYNSLDLVSDTSYDVNKMVEAKINELKVRFAQRKPANRPAQMGDGLVIDYRGTVNGTTLDGLSGDSFVINSLGSGKNVPGFDEQIVGLNIGESKEFTISFPDNYPSGLGGKDCVFKVTIKNIIEIIPSQENDDLAMMAGFSTLTELKDSLMHEANTEASRLHRESLELQIITKLAEKNTIDIPEGAVLQERNLMLRNLQQRGMGITNEIAATVESSARYGVLGVIIANAIFKQENMEIAADELNAELGETAKRLNKTKEQFIVELQNSGNMDGFLNKIRLRRVMDFIIERSNQNNKL